MQSCALLHNSTTSISNIPSRPEKLRALRGLPFVLRVPNETTRQTLDDTDAGKNLIYCRDAEDLFARLKL